MVVVSAIAKFWRGGGMGGVLGMRISGDKDLCSKAFLTEIPMQLPSGAGWPRAGRLGSKGYWS